MIQAEAPNGPESPIHRPHLPRIEVPTMMNKSEVSAILARDPFATTRAILLLWSYQTPHERQALTTVERNGKGFNVTHGKGAKARQIAYWVRWVLALPPNVSADRMSAAVAQYLRSDPRRYRCLTGTYLADAREVAAFYWQQLAAAAESRKALKVDVEHRGSDMSHLMRQFDRFQVYPGIAQHA